MTVLDVYSNMVSMVWPDSEVETILKSDFIRLYGSSPISNYHTLNC